LQKRKLHLVLFVADHSNDNQPHVTPYSSLFIDRKRKLHAYDPVMGACAVGRWEKRSVEEWADLVAGSMVNIQGGERNDDDAGER
jgi:hypothetical protein